ncbi:hypothetical protein NHF50_06945 [Flavobacterium sp. NRK F10]|uniref:Uncharacterized protein n=1 Tax=Flavobacterium sediminis TaxID=2201181 RepID=A0A2U8QV34_9FLAO|nr:MULTISPECIES: hypothetical protein [Flavobacterium]AWM13655.1 hypothetical protein DI487_07125 [Flavobacterium sediminis]MCO6174778.1 hypothetical protein [Flavobacterium sp. NRK F10]
MSTNSQDQEIDLGQAFQKIGGIFQLLVDKLFDGILFLKRNSIYLGVLLVTGVIAGYFMDKTNKSYIHEIIVSPNYGSVDYLYAKVALLDSKNKENDTVFFNDLGFKNLKNFYGIEIEPINDIYKFVDGKPQNFDLIKLMAEDGDIKEITVDQVTSKNFPFHLITFSTGENTNEDEIVKPLMNYLNSSTYFEAIKEQYIENQKEKLAANDSIIKQIDNLINEFSNTVSGGSKSDKLVYYSDNNQLGEIIGTKNNLIAEQGTIKMNILNNDKIIKEISTALNSKDTRGLNGKMKLLLPVLFIFVFLILAVLKSFYKYQLAKRNLN